MPAEPGRAPSGGELATLGATLAVAFVVPIGAGLWVDAAAHSSPLGLLVGIVAGITAAAIALRAAVRRYL